MPPGVGGHMHDGLGPEGLEWGHSEAVKIKSYSGQVLS